MNENYHRIGKNGQSFWGKQAAGFLITDGFYILLLRRSVGDNKDTWDLPGGKLKTGEDSFTAAKRESKEEIGRDLPQTRRIGKFEERDGLHLYTVFVMKVDKPFEGIHISKEHTEYKWVPINMVAGMNLHPNLIDDIKKYVRFITLRIPRGFKEWKEAVRNEDPVIIYVDLDETLCSVIPIDWAEEEHLEGEGIIVPGHRDVYDEEAIAFLRPHAKEFLAACKSIAPTIILTWGFSDIQSHITKQFGISESVMGKDKFGSIQPSENVILVDDRPISSPFTKDKVKAIGLKDFSRLVNVHPWAAGDKYDNGLMPVLPKVQELARIRVRQ